MTNILKLTKYVIFVGMSILHKSIYFLIVTFVIVPVWFLIATLNYIVFSMLFLLRINRDDLVNQEKGSVFKNNFKDYKSHLGEVFYFY